MKLTIDRGKKQTLKEKYGPLVKIVREEAREVRDHIGVTHIHLYEILECGHTVPVRKDIYGYTNAARRRCYKCRDGK